MMASKRSIKSGSKSQAPVDKARKEAIAEIEARIDGMDEPPPSASAKPNRGKGAKAAGPTPTPTTAPVADGSAEAPTPEGAPSDAAPADVAEPAPKSAAKPGKRVSALDAAAIVLSESATPMSAKQMVETAAAQGLWQSQSGKTPSATVYAAIIREISAKGKDARFVKTDRGQFAARR